MKFLTGIVLLLVFSHTNLSATDCYSISLPSLSTLDSIPKSTKKKYAFRQSPIVGTSLTYLPRSYFSNRLFHDIHVNELTWSINIAFPLKRRFDLGLNHYSVIKSDAERGRSHNWQSGIFAQFHFLYFPKGRFFFESGFYYGDYCHCIPDDYTQEGLVYASLGSGVNFWMSKHFALDLSILHFHIFNKLENKDTNSIYTAGINYQF